MKQILNRLAWAISIVFGFCVFLMVMLMFSIDIFKYGIVYLFPAIILTFIFSFIVKGMFFPKWIFDKLGKKYQGERVEESKSEVLDAQKNEVVEWDIPQTQSSVPLTMEELQTEQDIPVVTESIEENLPEVPKIEISQEPGFLKTFFSENALAKIGGILIFIGMVFFLSLIYNNLGPWGKLAIGFLASFVIYFVGFFLHQKSFPKEGKVLIGTSLLVNFLIILAGRYLIKLPGGNIFLSEGITFLFLILNTLFAIWNSVKYKSSILLLFAFIIGYANPFLVGGHSDNPYTVLIYNLCISLGGLRTAYRYYLIGEKNISKNLFYVIIFGSNILTIVAPFSSQIQWSIKLVALLLVSIFMILFAQKTDDKSDIAGVFLASYISFFIMLGRASHIFGGAFNSLLIYFSYIGFLGIMFAFSFLTLSVLAVELFLFILFLPLISIFGLLMLGFLQFAVMTVFLAGIVYMFGFVFLKNRISGSYKYFFLAIIFFFILFGNMRFSFHFDLDKTSFIIVMISCLIYLLFAYYYSFKDNMKHLYPLSNVGVILMIFPLLHNSGELRNLSIAALGVFSVLNLITPIIALYLKKIQGFNILIGIVAFSVFLMFEIASFFKLLPMDQISLIYISIAVVYLLTALIIYSQYKSSTENEVKSIFSGYISSTVGFVGIGLLYLFMPISMIYSLIWAVISTTLIWLFGQTQDKKIYFIANIFYLIGLLVSLPQLSNLRNMEAMTYIYPSILFVLQIANLFFMRKSHLTQNEKVAFDVINAISFASLYLSMIDIELWDHISEVYKVLFTSIYMLIVGGLYRFWGTVATKSLSYLALMLVLLYHIFFFFGNRAGNYVIHFIIIAINVLNVYIISPGLPKDNFKKLFFIISFAYFFFTTSFLIGDIFNNTFIVSIYWGILTFGLIFYGLQFGGVKYRTTGFYVLAFLLSKIFLYDIWYALSDAISRVVALVVIGGMLIYISMLYSKKMGGNLKSEFELKNLL